MFISYAQNFEDVMLNRVFANKEQGIYIDVGAQHPLYDSVTKAFYDRGWHGVNIEPVKEYYGLLVKERERDINLNLAVGETESELDFFELEGTGLSTFERETAERISQEEGYNINCYQVPVVKLADIIHQHLNCPIDFLKIDVQGWEEKVILGNDWARFRPKVIILDATLPNSPTRAKTNITEILKGHNYQQVYFDGINDYYLANENNELSRHFTTPPNVFDKFISYHLHTTQAHGKNLEAIIQARDEKISNIQQQLEQNIRHNHIIHNRLENETFEGQRLKKILTRSQNKAQENINFLNQEINKLKTELTTKNQEFETTKQELNTIKETNNFLTQEITQLKAQLTTKNQELNTNQQNNHLLTQEIAQLKTQLETTKQEFNTAKKSHHLSTQEIAQLKAQLTATKQEFNTAKKSHHLSNQEIIQLKTQLTATNQESNTIKQELNTTQKTNIVLNQEIAQLKAELTATSQHLNNANQLVAAMETSKFWKMRTIWFKIKSGLGIKQQ